MSFIQELKRRNVFRVAIAYAITTWLLLQVADVVLGNIEAPGWVFKTIMLVLALGFPVALLLAWAFELTPEGIKKEKDVDRAQSITPTTGRKLDYTIIALLALGLAYFIWESRFSGGAPDAEKGPDTISVSATGPDGKETANAKMVSGPFSRKSIAVLPFTTRSKVEDDQFFSDGMHDDLLTQLAKIGELKVISRTSVMEYRDTTKNLRQIATELGVSNILEGAIQRSGEQVRINVQLIDAQTDEHLWAEIYDRQLTAENLFTIQTEIAKAIAAALEATLSPEEQQRMDQAVLTNNMEALKAYQHAHLLVNDLQEKNLLRALEEAQRATELDPSFAAAWAVVAQAQLALHWNVRNSDERLTAAKQAIERGRSIDPKLPALDIAEGYWYYWGFRDYANAIRVLEPVERAWPNNAEVHKVLGWVYRRQGRIEDGLEQLHKAFELEPRSDEIAASLSETYLLLRDYKRAQEYLDVTEIINPTGSRYYVQSGDVEWCINGDPAAAIRSWEHVPESVHYDIWRANVALGNFNVDQDFEVFRGAWVEGDLAILPEYMHGLSLRLSGDPDAAAPFLDQAIAVYRDSLKNQPDDFHFLKPLCMAEGARGDVEATRQACQRALDNLPEDAIQLSAHRADIAGGLAMAGMKSEALDLVESVLSEPYGQTPVEIRLEPTLVSLHDEPRWKALMAEPGKQ